MNEKFVDRPFVTNFTWYVIKFDQRSNAAADRNNPTTKSTTLGHRSVEL